MAGYMGCFLELFYEIPLIPYMTFFLLLIICAYMPHDGEDTLHEMAHENRRGDGGLMWEGSALFAAGPWMHCGENSEHQWPRWRHSEVRGSFSCFYEAVDNPLSSSRLLGRNSVPLYSSKPRSVLFPLVTKYLPACFSSCQARGAGQLRRAKQDLL